MKHVYCFSKSLRNWYLEESTVEGIGESTAVYLANGSEVFQITLGSRDDYTAGVQGSVASDVLDDLAGFLKTGAVCDGVKNEEDVRVYNDVLKLLFRILKKRQK